VFSAGTQVNKKPRHEIGVVYYTALLLPQNYSAATILVVQLSDYPGYFAFA
jgi:hypothetical protein